ncbi:Holliday junction branch migration DNA helicase RuvB [Spiroplasma sp. SV19]|uniref:Holliday junction branch migration DNA helicase RuvB n=1 Tax=Spiroplasma sp. SV19 TaxID=2570468 RepID=UPI0024B71FB6|nr:Holliday junction branch migration DNA helicase RuvB [Spiroplasma sp. SV19]WHQ36481.1 Holliday junction branch migration DNA helicase RuvB [Spiroplasma sp. SV19]
MMQFNVRPVNFESYIGQTNIKMNLKVMLAASQKQHQPLKHMLFVGPTGVGKTSLAHLIKTVLQQKLLLLHGPNLQKPSDLISCLMQVKAFNLVFIDEIHAISREVAEILYPVLDDNCLNLLLGKDYNTKNVVLPLPFFTLLAATTLLYQVPQPLLNCFTTVFHFDEYTNDDMQQILNNLFLKVGIKLQSAELNFLACYSRNNPRAALKLFYRIYDYLLVTSQPVNLNFLQEILINLKIYQDGLDSREVNYLKKIYALFETQPVGLSTLSQILDEPLLTITNNLEPFLIKKGYLIKTSRGRVLTSKTIEFLKNIA